MSYHCSKNRPRGHIGRLQQNYRNATCGNQIDAPISPTVSKSKSNGLPILARFRPCGVYSIIHPCYNLSTAKAKSVVRGLQ